MQVFISQFVLNRYVPMLRLAKLSSQVNYLHPHNSEHVQIRHVNNESASREHKNDPQVPTQTVSRKKL